MGNLLPAWRFLVVILLQVGMGPLEPFLAYTARRGHSVILSALTVTVLVLTTMGAHTGAVSAR